MKLKISSVARKNWGELTVSERDLLKHYVARMVAIDLDARALVGHNDEMFRAELENNLKASLLEKKVAVYSCIAAQKHFESRAKELRAAENNFKTIKHSEIYSELIGCGLIRHTK